MQREAVGHFDRDLVGLEHFVDPVPHIAGEHEVTIRGPVIVTLERHCSPALEHGEATFPRSRDLLPVIAANELAARKAPGEPLAAGDETLDRRERHLRRPRSLAFAR